MEFLNHNPKEGSFNLDLGIDFKGGRTYIVNFEGKSMEVTFDDQILTSEKVISSLPNPYIASLEVLMF